MPTSHDRPTPVDESWHKRVHADVSGEEDTVLAQKLGRLQPSLAVLSGTHGPTLHHLGQPDTFLASAADGPPRDGRVPTDPDALTGPAKMGDKKLARQATDPDVLKLAALAKHVSKC